MTLGEASILIVDDEPVLRMTFAMILRQQGATVHLAAHGAQALELLELEAIDLMLTDKQMPVMDGITLLNVLCERAETLPTILFVNGVEGERQEDLERWGVMETLTKPVHPERLLTLLRKVLLAVAARGATCA